MNKFVESVPIWEDFPYEIPSKLVVRRGIYSRPDAYGNIKNTSSVFFHTIDGNCYLYYSTELFDKLDWNLIIKPTVNRVASL